MAAALPQLAPVLPPLRAARFNAEFDLLLACCSDSSDEQISDALQQARFRNLDWDLLARMASHHSVLSLVFQQFVSHSDQIPKHALENFKRLNQVNSRKTLWLTNELLHIAERLEHHRINFLAYKGPSLGQFLYRDVTVRQFGDLDLLVHPSDVARAISLVQELGYRSELALTSAQEHAYLRIGYERSFDSDFGRNLLEIKWQILPSFYAIDFDVEKIFLRSTSVKIGDGEVPTLSAEDLLLVLCVHAAKHGWEKLSWLCDIAALTRHTQLDWGAIQQRAKKLGIERILAINFDLMNQLLGTPIPESLLTYMEKDRVLLLFAGKIIYKIVACQNCDVASKAYFRDFAGLRERRSDIAKFWWRLITTPNVSEWKTAKLRNPQSPIYFGIRLYRLATKLIRN